MYNDSIPFENVDELIKKIELKASKEAEMFESHR
jgi:hypothetical protein